MNASRSVVPTAAALILAAIALVTPLPSHSQHDWTWPEKAENLEVLPKDIPAKRLRAVMTGFTRALGVRCSHCHVGEEGQPLSTYDFPSDDNPNKGRARVMLEMLASINEDLERIEPSGPERVNMWCHTCHRGRPRPQTLEEALTDVYRSDGIEGALARYDDLHDRFYGTAAYDFSERSLNRFGYHLLQSGDGAAAIEVFRLNVRQYPESANTHDSLGEGYLAAGMSELAITEYERSLAIDPNNANAAKMLEKLRSGDGGR